jgi:hypothetical protein
MDEKRKREERRKKKKGGQGEEEEGEYKLLLHPFWIRHCAKERYYALGTLQNF